MTFLGFVSSFSRSEGSAAPKSWKEGLGSQFWPFKSELALVVQEAGAAGLNRMPHAAR